MHISTRVLQADQLIRLTLRLFRREEINEVRRCNGFGDNTKIVTVKEGPKRREDSDQELVDMVSFKCDVTKCRPDGELRAHRMPSAQLKDIECILCAHAEVLFQDHRCRDIADLPGTTLVATS